MVYRSPSNDPHLRDEEAQWARVVERGDAARGLALVYVQKFCTAVHEFEPAYRAGLLDERAADHVRGRLLARLDYAARVLGANGLGDSPAAAHLAEIRAAIVSAPDMASLADLAEPLHRAAHAVCDALEV